MTGTSNNIITLRRHDLDNLKTFLAGLVVLHHTTIPYGGSPESYLRSVVVHGSSPALLAFKSMNQSFFMGTFFWISGRMTAHSLGKLAPVSFIGRKLLHLGVPTAFYTLFIIPAVRAVALPSWDLTTIRQDVLRYWASLGGVTGNSWYTATLLVLDVLAALAVMTRPLSRDLSSDGKSRDRKTTAASSPTVYSRYNSGSENNGQLAFPPAPLVEKWAWLPVALTSFLIRTQLPGFPGGRAWTPLNLHLSFLPQYVYAYVMGYRSFHDGRSRIYGPFDHGDVSGEDAHHHTSHRGAPSLSLGASIAVSAGTLACIVVPAAVLELAVGGGISKDSLVPAVLEQVSGGWNVSALLYSVWNEFSFVTITPALMAYFQQNYSQRIESWWWKPRYSYAVFLGHNVVSMAVAVAAESVCRGLLSTSSWARSFFLSRVWNMTGPSVLTVVVGSAQVFSSFVVGKFLVEYVPGLNRII
ncbi:hypothetical protein GQX73_g5992 [Xylaria multiplex]|uniref:Acyltransferase 3 domain-containing protein n=1 Tax=Xylaria multiplex TaxID=323545 RepID=A0A7C8MNQ8_9PEZI|nr:hypothetical protein GQX73_g5992 [Xylaria multiplex]